MKGLIDRVQLNPRWYVTPRENPHVFQSVPQNLLRVAVERVPVLA